MKGKSRKTTEDMPQRMWLDVTIRVAHYFVYIKAKPHYRKQDREHTGNQVVMVGLAPVVSFNCNTENYNGYNNAQHYKITYAFRQKKRKQCISNYKAYYQYAHAFGMLCV